MPNNIPSFSHLLNALAEPDLRGCLCKTQLRDQAILKDALSSCARNTVLGLPR
jgi:hypothetical protein